MLIDRVRSRKPNGVRPIWLDPGNRIAGPAVESKKLLSSHLIRQVQRVRSLELVRTKIRKVSVPAWIVNRNTASRTEACVQLCEFGDHAKAHEGTESHRGVVGTRYRVANRRVEAPDRDPGRQGNRLLQFCGLAEQRKQPVRLTAARGHLVHDPAGGTDYAVLHNLA